VVRAGEERNCTRFRLQGPKERGVLEDRSVDGSMGPEWMLGRWCGRILSGLNCVRIVNSGGLL
jgi:hypothetical protein